MNKTYKHLSLMVVATLGAGLLSSCDTSKDNDYVSEYEGAPGIYFSTTANSYLELDDQKSTITYYAYRDVAGDEVTVGLSVDALDAYEDPDIYTFPTSVTFPAGSKVADIVIGYDINRTTLGEEQQYQLTLDAEPNPFSSNSVIITLVNPAPWTLLGTSGQFYDYGWGVNPDYSTGPVTVNVYQQGVDKNIYRISNPYVGWNGEETYFQFRVLQQGETYLGVPITMPDLVGYDMYYINYDPDDQSDIYLAFPGIFADLDDIGYWTNNRVVEYQDNGLPGIVQLAPLYYASAIGAAYGDLSPYVYIYFPGYVSLDTSLEIQYEGTLTTEGQEEYVLLSGEIGEDVSEVRVAISSTMTEDELVQAIEDETIEYTTFNSTGSWKVPFDNMSTGRYTVAAVAYVDGVAKNYATVAFFYVATDSGYDPNEGWNSLGYVQYTDGYIVAGIFTGTSTITYWVEIQENKETSGLYRLVNPYGTYFASFFGDSATSKDVPPSYIVIDATNPYRVKVLETEQVIEFNGEYGLVLCWSWADMWLQQGATEAEVAREGVFGTYVSGKITFPAMALCSIWSDEPDTWYSANYALDYDAMQAGSKEPLYYNEDGSIYAPFCVDMNTLTPDDPTVQANSLAMPRVSLPVAPFSQFLKAQPTHLPLPGKLEKNTGKLKKTTPKSVRRVK